MQTSPVRAQTPLNSLEPQDDACLVELARRNDEAAIRTLIRRHNRRLFRIARSIVRDDAEAEDIVQETYVKAFTNLASFRGEARMLTWLTRIALNEALGRLRRRRPTAELKEVDRADEAQLIPFPGAHVPDPEAETARSQLRDLLERTVDDLPEPFRIVFILRDVEEMSIEETAILLAIRPETVKTRLHRARTMMRNSIERRFSATFSSLFPFDGMRCARMGDRVIARLREHRNI
ncbi:RNA polymerase sigma factor [Pseudaminobacter salicylatoxidans]|uniref:RNA polymerase sigma factor n=1 Tax=Pseudaminobacter salicylatoxidans TaxID=93369 RepID=UPI0003033DD7|nr:RNA polymerase sigma factor [Pseudaminobacter salicylatoxidans]